MNSEKKDPELRQVLGPISATCIVVGAIVGVGIFFTPTDVAKITQSGSLALITWCVGGFLALLGALTFAELGGMYPRTGAQYEILKDSYGRLVAFLYVFCNATAIQSGAIAIIAFVAASNCLVLFGPSDLDLESVSPIVIIALASLFILVITVSNVVGVRWGSSIQNVTVFVKIGALLLIAAIAVFATDFTPITEPTNPPETDNNASQHFLALLFAGMIPVMFSFGGWQHALWIGGEIKNPSRNVPLAIIGGVLVVIVSYLLVNWAYLHLLGYHGVVESKAIAADAVSQVWPNIGKRLIAAAVAFSAIGVLNAQLLSGPRLICGMARDGRFFKPFANVHASFQTPIFAIILLGGIGFILLVTAGKTGVESILTGVVLIDTIFFALTAAAIFVLRRKKAAADRPVRVPIYPIIPLVFVLGEILVIIGAFLQDAVREGAIIGVCWVIGAAVFYFLFFRKTVSTNASPKHKRG